MRAQASCCLLPAMCIHASCWPWSCYCLHGCETNLLMNSDCQSRMTWNRLPDGDRCVLRQTAEQENERIHRTVRGGEPRIMRINRDGKDFEKMGGPHVQKQWVYVTNVVWFAHDKKHKVERRIPKSMDACEQQHRVRPPYTRLLLSDAARAGFCGDESFFASGNASVRRYEKLV